jgi:hypothetical protein
MAKPNFMTSASYINRLEDIIRKCKSEWLDAQNRKVLYSYSAK